MNAAELRSRILANDDLPREPADVPWETNGTKIYVQALRYADISRFMQDGALQITGDVMPELLVRTLVTEAGEPIFHRSDVKALARKDQRVIAGLFGQVMRLSGLAPDADQELAASFGEAPSEPSSTG